MLNLKAYYPWLKLAGALLLVIGGVWLYSSQVPAPEVQFVTQDKVQLDTLTDGSIVTLNKQSLVRYPEDFKGEARKVWLTKGEVFFQAIPKEKMPFIVTASSTVIKTSGADFNVKKRGGVIEVIVERGTVEVSKNDERISLKAGEKVLTKQNTNKLDKESNPDLLYNYYRSNEFVTSHTSLSRLVQVLNETYRSHIIIRRKTLKDSQLNGTFKNESLESVLEQLNHKLPVKIERKQNRILLY